MTGDSLRYAHDLSSALPRQNAKHEPIIQTQEKITALTESLLEKSILNNMNRELLETQHSKFETSRFGFNRESIILFQEHEKYSYLNHIIIFTKLFRNVIVYI